MGLLAGGFLSVLGLALAIVTAVIARLVTDDVKEWLPRVKVRLIESAVRKLPGDQRERYLEEWSAFIEDTPGDLSKVIVAFGLGFAAKSIAGMLYTSYSKVFLASIQRVMQRIARVTFGLALLSLMGPLFLFLAALIKWETPGPILTIDKYRKKDGQIVRLFSFRTKHVDAGADWNNRVANSAYTNDSGSYGSFYISGGRRFTRVGWVMRRTGHDKIPRLLNLVRGDVSITSVGRQIWMMFLMSLD